MNLGFDFWRSPLDYHPPNTSRLVYFSTFTFTFSHWLSQFHAFAFTLSLPRFQFQTFTLWLSYLDFHSFTFTISLSHFHFHTFTFILSPFLPDQSLVCHLVRALLSKSKWRIDVLQNFQSFRVMDLSPDQTNIIIQLCNDDKIIEHRINGQ